MSFPRCLLLAHYSRFGGKKRTDNDVISLHRAEHSGYLSCAWFIHVFPQTLSLWCVDPPRNKPVSSTLAFCFWGGSPCQIALGGCRSCPRAELRVIWSCASVFLQTWYLQPLWVNLLPHGSTCPSLLNARYLFSGRAGLGGRPGPVPAKFLECFLINTEIWLLVMEETPFPLGSHSLLFQDSLALINMLLTARNQEVGILNPVTTVRFERGRLIRKIHIW